MTRTASASWTRSPKPARRPVGPDSESGVVETPQPNLVAGMKWLPGTCTMRYNRRHKELVHSVSGRHEAVIVDGSGNGCLKTVCGYVHLNPHGAKLFAVGQPRSDFPWSRCPQYLAAPSRRPAWLRVDWLLADWGMLRDSAAGRAVLAERMEGRGRGSRAGEFKPFKRGRCRPRWRLITRIV